jgi:hypothetical protein
MLPLLLTLSLAVIVAVASVGIVTLLLPDGSSTPQVTTTTIQGVGFGWESPPSPTSCSNSILNWTESPQVPFNTSSGATFNVSYRMICDSNASTPYSSYAVYAAASACPGVAVVASNVPVVVGTAAPSWLNVTVQITNAEEANSITIQITTSYTLPPNV